MTLAGVLVQPWQVALAFGALFFVLYGYARLRLARAIEDFANAFFYSPSQKTKQRHLRQRWQDRSWALLAATGAFLVAAAILYTRGPR